MIPVTRLSGGQVIINIDLVLAIEQTPDTVLAFVNGDRLFVRETPAEVIERAVAFHRRVGLREATSAAG